ncbi:MAG: ATP-dependent Clp protease ATP-binding subunit [Spirochaetes bacterium]|nr:ATP-dependent Clp protease ATP-binding subunit [Spirochaetota bacterium]MBX3720355.1 ATP-dependent Clp protease ATP-binding subunit [Turneriella sp.]
MFDFTNRVKKIINEYAPREAKRLGHEFLGPEHILLGLLKAQDSVAVKMLMNLGIDLGELRKEIEKRSEQDSATLVIDPTSKDKVQRILELSRDEARKMRHSYIGSEHVLLSLLRDTNGIVAAALQTFQINYQVIRNELNATLGLPQATTTQKSASSAQPKKEASKTPMLDEFARNLSRMAEEKLTDPVIGRDHEIERVIQILSRKTKNNPILIGEAGVGKTAIAEGLAQRIAQKRVPEPMFNRQVYSLDVAALIAGTKYRGEFEDRIKKIMKEIRTNREVILFIDEVHTIIGAGAAEGAVDAANILKPALARGEIQCIGATTLREYKRYIERDSALERRFQSVMVEEPSVEDAIRILAGLRHAYEKHHAVSFSKEAIISAVKLSDRYIKDRFLPDKAIDIIDEAGSHARLKSAVIPEEIKEIEKEMQQLTRDKNEMVRQQEYEKAAKLRDQIGEANNRLAEAMNSWRRSQKEARVEITAEDISKVIADWTGIPLQQLKDNENERLIKMPEELADRVVGQKAAIDQISRAVRRARMGLKSVRKPIGSFIFLGPTGVGKTELAKALAEFMFGDEEALIRFDMSEYMEMHSVSKFIGSPPGYVGHEDGGQLTEAIRRHPHSVLLFDEIEKAHAEIQNILLQVLDEGELTDNAGHHVDFKETIIILTSNIGARFLQKGGKLGFGEAENKQDGKREQVLEELRKHFSPEFLNRIDDVIIFDPLTREEIQEIVDLTIDEINYNALLKNMYLTLKGNARSYLAEKGYSEKYGARPLKRLVQREIEDELAMMLLEKKITEPVEIKISTSKKDGVEKLTFAFENLSAEKFLEIKSEYFEDEASIDEIWENSLAEHEEGEAEDEAESEVTQK